MSEMRVALYVYAKTEVGLTPSGTIDLHRMGSDYTASFVAAYAAPTVLELAPGVYGFSYKEAHGLTASADVKLVIQDTEGRKTPWPRPPPPPPEGFAGRRDWIEHTAIFMARLGDELPSP
jgi:hypothetical protein